MQPGFFIRLISGWFFGSGGNDVGLIQKQYIGRFPFLPYSNRKELIKIFTTTSFSTRNQPNEEVCIYLHTWWSWWTRLHFENPWTRNRIVEVSERCSASQIPFSAMIISLTIWEITREGPRSLAPLLRHCPGPNFRYALSLRSFVRVNCVCFVFLHLGQNVN